MRKLVRENTKWRVMDFKRHQKKVTLFDDVFGQENAAAEETLEGRDASPAEMAITKEKAERLRDCIGRLTKLQQFAVVLKYYEGLTSRQIAGVLKRCAEIWPHFGLSGNASEDSINVELTRARQNLRQCAEERDKHDGKPTT
jgi:hypothetical protein